MGRTSAAETDTQTGAQVNDYQATAIIIGLAIVGCGAVLGTAIALIRNAIDDWRRKGGKFKARDAWKGEWH